MTHSFPTRRSSDLAVYERLRKYRRDLPASDFTVVYQLLSIERDMTRSGSADIRLKVALQGESPHLPTATTVYEHAHWYERGVWALFGDRKSTRLNYCH